MYRLLAGDEPKEWLPKEKPFVVMKDVPPGYPTLLKPRNARKATPNVMDTAMDHLSLHLTGADIKWWRSFIASKREKRVLWEEMTEDKYIKAGEPFDISALHFKPLSSDQDDEDEDMLRTEAVILRQLNKEHRQVRNIKF